MTERKMNVVELISQWAVKLMGYFIFLPHSKSMEGKKLLVGLTVKI